MNIPKPLTQAALHELKYHTHYRLQNFYPVELLDLIRRKWRDLPMNHVVRTYNLFHVERYQTKEDLEILQAMTEFTYSFGLTSQLHCVYRYHEGSFARLHSDMPGVITFVTLLEPNTAVGGDAIILDKHRITIDSGYHDADGKVPDNIEKHEIIEPREILYMDLVPRILPLRNVDETLFYPTPSKTKHGVTPVESGERVVLIHWMTEPKT